MRKASAHILAADPKFELIIETSPLCNIGRKKYQEANHFQALVNSVIAQQISVKAADSITARVSLALDGNISPTTMRDVTDLDLRAAGLSGAKTRTIKEMAHAWHVNEYDFSDPQLTDNEIVQELTKLWGNRSMDGGNVFNVYPASFGCVADWRLSHAPRVGTNSRPHGVCRAQGFWILKVKFFVPIEVLQPGTAGA